MILAHDLRTLGWLQGAGQEHAPERRANGQPYTARSAAVCTADLVPVLRGGSETGISGMATGQPTLSQSENGCDLSCSRSSNNGPTMRSNRPTKVSDQRRLPPVRVKLLRPYAFEEETTPPEGESAEWWSRLNKALGTVSSDFVRASLLQLQGAARSPYGTVSELAINAALAMIEAAAPKDELEGALAVQMACCHMAAMAVLSKLDSGFETERRTTAFGSTAARLMKAYAIQMEVLRRLRTGGHQFVRVEHVYVNAGGQAVIANVKTTDPEGQRVR